MIDRIARRIMGTKPANTGSVGALARKRTGTFNLKQFLAPTNSSRFALIAGEGARAPSIQG